MKEREIFSTLSVPAPAAVRLDGRAFHTLTAEKNFEKPYDSGFNDCMCRVCELLLSDSGLYPDFAYTFSDEISLYFSEMPFNGRIEKINSVAASFASSAFTLAMNLKSPVSFDSRVILLGSDEITAEYFSWRQKEAWRNHINAYCQHALISEGATPQKAAKMLRNVKSGAMHEMMHERGINLSKTPAWQRRGNIIRRETYIKKGYNPITKTEVQAVRRRVVRDAQPPVFNTPEGKEYLKSLVCAAADRNTGI